jgi:hypothetical protein
VALSVDQAKSRVKKWTGEHCHAVLYDEENFTLLDVASGKTLLLRWPDVTGFEEKIHPETQDTYLVVRYENGAQIALVNPGGVAFAPSDASTGPRQDLPQAVCLKDFVTLKHRVDHYLYQHGDEPPPRECLDMVMICIAILDGARRVGFDVGEQEGELDQSLREIERRRS